jgi:hypothetical protein
MWHELASQQQPAQHHDKLKDDAHPSPRAKRLNDADCERAG